MLNCEFLFLAGVLLIAVSGLPGLFIGRKSAAGERLGTLIMISGCTCGAAGVMHFLVQGESFALWAPSPVADVHFSISLDAISAIFLMPIFVVAALGSIYGLSYWKQSNHPENGARLRFFFGLLPASMALLVVANDGVTFLFAWEAMALAAFFLVATEHHNPEVMKAAWLYLAVSHFATLCLIGVFALIDVSTGSFGFRSLAAAPPGTAAGIFVLSLVGFGVKAGIMPLHIWLPSADAMAPSHVSALLSGVVIKMGIYGIVRVTSLFPDPPLWWGNVVLGLGVISGVLGVAFAIGQHDVKRLLAYHSIENIGIIVMGLGLALIGRSLHQPAWIALGLAGAYLHVWNHAVFKSLLFYSAGSVIHAVHTREIDRLGGLGRQMPWTSLGFLIGAVAICGLPPLNGFVSELFIFLGLFRTLGLRGEAAWGIAAYAAPVLALIGALASACFVKVFGVVFLGAPRSEHANRAHESPLSMIAPMAVLAGICFFIGLAPFAVAPMLDKGIAAWSPGAALAVEELAPLDWVSAGGGVLLLLLSAGSLFLWLQLRGKPVSFGATWGCGYAANVPRAQYSASSFAQMLVDLFGWALRPHKKAPIINGIFPQKARFESHVPDGVLDGAVVPSSRFLYRVFAWSRILHQGSIHAYLLYIVATLIVLLLWI